MFSPGSVSHTCVTFQVVCRVFFNEHLLSLLKSSLYLSTLLVSHTSAVMSSDVVLNHSCEETEKPLEVLLARRGVHFHSSALLIWSRRAFKVLTECYTSPLATLVCLNMRNYLACMTRCHKDVLKWIRQKRISAVTACNFKLHLLLS